MISPHLYFIKDKPCGDTIRIYFIGDLHIGNNLCAYDELQKTVKIIQQDRNAYVVMIGDLMDAINHKDKRFNPDEIADHYRIMHLKDLPVIQANEVCEIINPIKDKIIAYIEGNHCQTFKLKNGFDPITYLKAKIDNTAPILGKKGFIVLQVTPQGYSSGFTYVIACMHGSGGGGYLAGTPLNNVTTLFNDVIADCRVIGHVHKMTTYPVDYQMVNTNGGNKVLKIFRAWSGTNGCYLYKDGINKTGYFEDRKGGQSSIGYLTYEIKISSNKEKSEAILVPHYFTRQY